VVSTLTNESGVEERPKDAHEERGEEVASKGERGEYHALLIA